MEKPYLFLKFKNGEIICRGNKSISLGHEISLGCDKKSDGVYARWKWDGKELIVENDRYGFFQVYYYCYNNEICLSPSIECLLSQGAPKDLDYTALSVFLRLGLFIEEDTPFQYIRALPPDVKFSWKKGKLNISGKYFYPNKNIKMDYDQALDRFNDLFAKAMKKRLPKGKNFVLPLTGGKDSRHILLELYKQGLMPEEGVTARLYPPRNDNDVVIATQIAKRLGIKHSVLDQPKSYFKVLEQRNSDTNFCSDEILESGVVVDYIVNKTNSEIFYDGLYGAGFLLDEYNFGLYSSEKYRELADNLMKGMGKNCFGDKNIKLIFKNAYSSQMSRDCALDHVVKALKRNNSQGGSLKHFLFWNRTRRELSLSAYGVYQRIPIVFSPYIDYDLFDFVTSLDDSMFINNNFAKDAVLRAYPEYADIPFTTKKNAPEDTRTLRRKYVWELFFYGLKEFRNATGVLNMPYIMGRLLNYLIRENNWWIRPELIHYVIHLNKIAK